MNHDWGLRSVVRCDEANPCLSPDPRSTFHCPLSGPTQWEAKDLMQPATVVRDGQVWMLYRAEDTQGRLAGVSRVGLAVSDDGRHFERRLLPVLYPDRDAWTSYEWEGGCEDQRLVEDEQGTYYLTYTAWNGTCARLCIATSGDLLQWHKHGPVFTGSYRDSWSKAGAIVCRRVGERLVATRINGRYWMYWGESDVFAATSDDLIHWEPVEYAAASDKRLHFNGTGYTEELIPGRPAPLSVMRPRHGRFDSYLVEPGPPALWTEQGILLIYNSCNRSAIGDSGLPNNAYAPGQVLFDSADPTAVVARSAAPFLRPERPFEVYGQTPNVCFVQGLTPFRGEWLLYYGAADSRIAVATAQLAVEPAS